MKKRLLLLLPFVLMLLLTLPVLADGLYRAEVTVTDISGSDREGVAVLIPFNSDSAVSLGYLGADGLDSRFLEGTTERAYMIADDKLGLFMPELIASQEREYRFETSWSPEVTDFGVILGDGGYVTISDAAALELGGDFKIEFDGMVSLPSSDSPPVMEGYENTVIGYSASWVCDLPSGIEAGELLLLFVAGYTSGNDPDITVWPSGWTELYKEDPGAYAGGLAYKVAAGTETGTVTVTVDEQARACSQIIRISGRVGTPELVTHSVGGTYHPGSYSISQSWGLSSLTMWISAYTGYDSGALGVSSYPDGYTGIGYTASDSGHGILGSAYRTGRATSEDPYRFTLNSNADYWKGYTVAIQSSSSSPIVSKGGSYHIYSTSSGVSASIVTNADVGWDSYGDANDRLSGYSSDNQRYALLFDDEVEAGYVSGVSFNVRKVGSPTGTAYARLRRVSDDGVIGTFGSMDVSTISTSSTWYSFTTPVYNPAFQRVRLTLEYDVDLGSSNYLRCTTLDSSSGILTGELSLYQSSTWSEPSDTPMVRVDFSECYVEASLGESGKYLLEVSGDGTDLILSVDSVEKDREVISGILDSSDDWVISLSYFDYYEHTVSDTLVVDYDPDSIISGTTLPDEEGTAQDGVITWGANTDLTVEVGGLQSITGYTSESSEEGGVPSVAPDLPDLPLFPEGEAITTLPWYDLVSPAAIGLEWSTNTLYGILFIFVAIGVGVGVMIATGSALLGAIATGAGLAVAAGTGTVGWWVLIVYALFAAGYLVVARSV